MLIVATSGDKPLRSTSVAWPAGWRYPSPSPCWPWPCYRRARPDGGSPTRPGAYIHLLVCLGVALSLCAALSDHPHGPGQDLLLLYRVRSPTDIVFRNELERIAQRRGARVQYLFRDQIGPLSADLFRYLVPNLIRIDHNCCKSTHQSNGPLA